MNMNMDLNQNMINRLIGVYHKINKIIAQDNNSHIKRETTTLRKWDAINVVIMDIMQTIVNNKVKRIATVNLNNQHQMDILIIHDDLSI